MPRLPEIRDKSQLGEDHHAIFDSIAASRGRVGFPFSLLLNSPDSAGRVAHLGHYLRFESALSPVQREVAILTAARESDCAFEWAAHVRLGKQAGVRDEVIDVIANRRPAGGLSGDEAAIIEYGRRLLREHSVESAAFDAVRRLFGDQGVVDLTVLLGYYTMIACALNAFEVEPPEGSAVLP